VVAVAWRTPRFDPAKPGRELPQWPSAVVDSAAVRWFVAVAAAMLTVWVAVAAIWGPQGSDNALPGVFYVLLWVGLAVISDCGRPNLACDLARAHRMATLAHWAARRGAQRGAYAIPAGLGVLARCGRAVRLRMA